MEADGERAPVGVRDFLFEAILALATLTRWPILDQQACGTREQRARAMVFVPVIGFAFGVLLTLVDRVLANVTGLTARSWALILIETAVTLGLPLRGLADTVEAIRWGARPAATGLSQTGPLGLLAALTVFGLQVWCLSTISTPAARASALLMSSMLSRWSIVPTGYGLKALEPDGLGVPYHGGISFREFAVSSAIALGLTMGLYESVGLAVIVALALLILAMRLILSRRVGGVPGFALAGASSAAELLIFAVLASLRSWVLLPRLVSKAVPL